MLGLEGCPTHIGVPWDHLDPQPRYLPSTGWVAHHPLSQRNLQLPAQDLHMFSPGWGGSGCTSSRWEAETVPRPYTGGVDNYAQILRRVALADPTLTW